MSFKEPLRLEDEVLGAFLSMQEKAGDSSGISCSGCSCKAEATMIEAEYTEQEVIDACGEEVAY